MNKSPAFQFYPDKWQSHTRRLSDSSYRVFHELMCWMWQHSPDQCSIEATPEAVSCALAMPSTTVEPALNEINNPYSPLLKCEDGRWVMHGLRKEAEKQSEWRRKSSLAGKASAAKRNNRTNVEPPLNQRSNLVEPKSNSPTLSPSPTPLSMARSRTTFQKPSIEEVKLQCAKIGLPETEAEGYWNFYESNGWKVSRNPMRSWTAALVNWKRNYEKPRFNGKHSGNPYLKSDGSPDRNYGTL